MAIHRLKGKIADLQRKLSLLEKIRDEGAQLVLKTGPHGRIVTVDQLHQVVKMQPTGKKALYRNDDEVLAGYATRMKDQPTYPEQLFSERLTKAGIPFVAQLPVMQFIVDFYIPAYGLIIELDGEQHRDQAEYDRARDTALRSRRCHVWRIPNKFANSFNVNEILLLPRVEWRIERAPIQSPRKIKQTEPGRVKPRLIKAG